MMLTKFEAELRLNDADTYASMRRRMRSMLTAAERFRQHGRNKNAGVYAALMAALYEINERMQLAYDLTQDCDEGDRVGKLCRAELHHYYPIIRRMYDQFASSRLLEPSEVTESTMEGAVREAAQRDRDNPVLVWAHDDDCTVDHIPNGPRSRRKNCPTPEEWED